MHGSTDECFPGVGVPDVQRRELHSWRIAPAVFFGGRVEALLIHVGEHESMATLVKRARHLLANAARTARQNHRLRHERDPKSMASTGEPPPSTRGGTLISCRQEGDRAVIGTCAGADRPIRWPHALPRCSWRAVPIAHRRRRTTRRAIDERLVPNLRPGLLTTSPASRQDTTRIAPSRSRAVRRATTVTPSRVIGRRVGNVTIPKRSRQHIGRSRSGPSFESCESTRAGPSMYGSRIAVRSGPLTGSSTCRMRPPRACT